MDGFADDLLMPDPDAIERHIICKRLPHFRDALNRFDREAGEARERFEQQADELQRQFGISYSELHEQFRHAKDAARVRLFDALLLDLGEPQ